MKKIPLSASYVDDINSGKLKVVSRDDRIFDIVSFDSRYRDGEGIVFATNGEDIVITDGKGHYNDDAFESANDLFILSPDEYMPDLEKSIKSMLDVYAQLKNSDAIDDIGLTNIIQTIISLVRAKS